MKSWLLLVFFGLDLFSFAALASGKQEPSVIEKVTEQIFGECHSPFKGKTPPPYEIKPLANLCGAVLSRADLGSVNLSSANLSRADLSGVNLSRANLSGAILYEADLSGATLINTSLSNAFLVRADLSGANLYQADLTGSSLDRADLTGANLSEANFNVKNFKMAKLFGAIFDPQTLPDLSTMATAQGMETMIYTLGPVSMVKLRKEFRENGFNIQGNAITTAIKRTEQRNLHRSKGSVLDKLEYYLKELAFEIPIAWGYSPSRALILMFVLIPVFAIPYIVVASSSFRRAGIWRKWSDSEKRPPKVLNRGYLYSTEEMANNKEPERLHRKWPRAMLVGLYFSLLSATRIGWRELTIGSWLERIQMREYTLYGTGWVRSIAGIQSLISVYLIAMWALTAFGHPFE